MSEIAPSWFTPADHGPIVDALLAVQSRRRHRGKPRPREFARRAGVDVRELRVALANYPEKRSLLRATPRLLQILRVLARPRFIGALRGKGHLPSPKEVRETFEELGLTFVKFGQVLALRRDLLPDAYIDELELLHDQLPAMDIQVVRATVERELGAPWRSCFAEFGETPLAAATIAQVHEGDAAGRASRGREGAKARPRSDDLHGRGGNDPPGGAG